jgi:hypothetical protein
MGYAEALMSTGESIVRRERQHWIVLLWTARAPLLAIVAALLLFVVGGNLSADGASGTFRSLLGIATAVLFIVGLAFLAWDVLCYLNEEYVLTNRRVIQVSGVMNKRTSDSSLEKINDAVLTQSLFGRMLGFGDLEILTASEAGIERFRMLIDPIGFKRAMLDAKHEYEVDMSGRGSLPGPPLRASRGDAEDETAPVPSVPSSASPVPAFGAAAASGMSPALATPSAPPSAAAGAASHGTPVARATARMTPDEVTRTLSSLADLRDRDAISVEEYEAKKAELLARL